MADDLNQQHPQLRQFQRAQLALRAFFGMGPSQFDSMDLMIPTLDLNWLLASRDELQIVVDSTTIAAVAPGAFATASLLPPGPGVWTLEAWGVDTSGPATSGSSLITAAVQLVTGQWNGVGAWLPLLQNDVSLAKAGVMTKRIGERLTAPIFVYRQNNPISNDSLQITVQNASGSVGNLAATAMGLFRFIGPAIGRTE